MGKLMRLLAQLAAGELPREEVLEMIKRLHIPGYEAARHHFEEAIEMGVFEPDREAGCHAQADIRAVLEWVRRKER